MGRECNLAILEKALHKQGLSVEDGFPQSKDAMVYVAVISVEIMFIQIFKDKPDKPMQGNLEFTFVAFINHLSYSYSNFL